MSNQLDLYRNTIALNRVKGFNTHTHGFRDVKVFGKLTFQDENGKETMNVREVIAQLVSDQETLFQELCNAREKIQELEERLDFMPPNYVGLGYQQSKGDFDNKQHFI